MRFEEVKEILENGGRAKIGSWWFNRRSTFTLDDINSEDWEL